MSLQIEGFLFCLSPDFSEGRWIDPIIKPVTNPDWIDCTAMSSDEFFKFVMANQPHHKVSKNEQ